MSSNRSFGLLFFIVFFIFGLWPLKNDLELNYIFIGISIIFLNLKDLFQIFLKLN